MRKVYLDSTELQLTGIGSVGIQDTEIIFAGAIIISMSNNDKNHEYERYSEDCDIHFIFEDCVPNLEFYTVPLVDIFAIDSEGGFLVSLGQQFDLESDAPICYINKDLECFIVSENVREFLGHIETWKSNLKSYDKVTFYNSKIEAEKELEFINLADIII